MAEQNDAQEKTLDPTPQRIERARKEGDVPQSQDVNTFAAYLALMAALALSAGSMGYGFGAPLTSFIGAPELLFDHLIGPAGAALTADILLTALWPIAPLFAAPAIGALIAILAQRAFVLAPKKILPKASRINPVETAKQKFGPTGLVEFAKSTTKLLAIGFVLVTILYWKRDEIIGLVRLDARALPEMLLAEALTLIAATAVVVGVIAALDFTWQRHSHLKKLRMSHQELKDETKTSEGDPHLKAARRERARKVSQSQMMREVPKADVVIVNPTHYAVALKWSREPGAAPTCVAKGVDAMAAKIRELAKENQVPIHSDPPTARALHASVEIGDEIAPDHYQAVAVAIRFADTVRRRARGKPT